MAKDTDKSDSCVGCIFSMLLLAALPGLVWLMVRQQMLDRYFAPLMVLVAVVVATIVVSIAWSVARSDEPATGHLQIGDSFKIPSPLVASVVWLLVFGAMINALDVMRPEQQQPPSKDITKQEPPPPEDNKATEQAAPSTG